MKIVQTNKAYFPKVGGIETTITTLSEGLATSFKADVTALVCNEKTNLKKIEKIINGVKIKYLSTYGFIASLPLSPSYFKELSKLSGDILHVHQPFPLADLSILFSPKIRKNFSRIVVSWHSDIVRQKWVLSYYKKYIHKFLQIADKIIVSNPRLIENSDFLKFYREKCIVIPIGINLDWANSKSVSNNLPSQSDQGNKEPSILFVGRLVYYKGIEYLINSINLVPNVSLVIIGSGPLERLLLDKIKDLNLETRIKIIPEVDEATLRNYYKSCDLFVLPSVEKSETYGIVQIEAMACGKPVICTEIGTGTSFINQDGITGLVVPPRDSYAIAEAINKILTNSKLRSELAEGARMRALSEFKSEIMVKSIYDLYQELLKDPSQN